jgi:hypothetical protein
MGLYKESCESPLRDLCAILSPARSVFAHSSRYYPLTRIPGVPIVNFPAKGHSAGISNRK